MSLEFGPMRLVISRCTRHGYHMVSVENEAGGTRVTPDKCCGGWNTVRDWALSARDWRDLERQAREAAEELEANQ